MNPLQIQRGRRYLTTLTAYAFILLFLYAATDKLLGFEEFNEQLARSPLVADHAWLVALLVPVTEITVCVLLFTNSTRLFALYMSFALMVLFSAYIFTVLHIGEHIPCSCGGVFEKMNWEQHLVFNISAAWLGGLAVLLHESPAKKRAGTT